MFAAISTGFRGLLLLTGYAVTAFMIYLGLVGSKLRFWPSWGTHNEQAASPRSFRTADFSDNRGEALRIRHIGVDGVR